MKARTETESMRDEIEKLWKEVRKLRREQRTLAKDIDEHYHQGGGNE